jgi:hypothetical protein
MLQLLPYQGFPYLLRITGNRKRDFLLPPVLFGEGVGSTRELIDMLVLSWKEDGAKLHSPRFWTEELVRLSNMPKSGPKLQPSLKIAHLVDNS